MAGNYEIHWETAANRLEFKLTGVFDDASFAKWDAAYRAAAKQAPAPGWDTLADMTEFPPQTAEIQRKAEEMIGHSFANGAARAALIAPKAVISLQAKRLASNAGVAERVTFVATRQEALDWLASHR